MKAMLPYALPALLLEVFEEHGPDYDARFFQDLDGIKYEIVYSKPEGEVV